MQNTSQKAASDPARTFALLRAVEFFSDVEKKRQADGLGPRVTRSAVAVREKQQIQRFTFSDGETRRDRTSGRRKHAA